ncbi:MAG TPA: DNA-processing protein DprA [Alphaproteobacteria bacterium]|nr:DNA-processing protein DprA [Alphaproteobacteria bacterium]
MNLSAERLAVLRIARSGGVGPVTYKKIVSKSGTPLHAVLEWKKFAGEKILATEESVLRELETLEKNNGWCVCVGDENYPRAFEHLPDAPVVLCGLGDASWLNTRQVAVVGNRNASAAGLQWTRELASTLVANGLTITSGLARGIDSAAHRGALDAHGGTVAVVAGGVNHIYPPENDKLRAEIIEHGCVVSEQPWGMVPVASFFPRRNRIIAGLSLGLVVSEASRESGSLISAKCALEYGREVWAVPGSPTDPRAGGPNWLLKQGATLIENAADILQTVPRDFLPPAQNHSRNHSLPLFGVDEEEAAAEELAPTPAGGLAGMLGRTGVTVDVLVRQSGKPEAAILGELVELELMGHAVREADGTWRTA